MSYIYDGIWCLELPSDIILTSEQIDLHYELYFKNLDARTDDDDYNDIVLSIKNFVVMIQELLHTTKEEAERFVQNGRIFSPVQLDTYMHRVGYWDLMFNFLPSDPERVRLNSFAKLNKEMIAMEAVKIANENAQKNPSASFVSIYDHRMVTGQVTPLVWQGYIINFCTDDGIRPPPIHMTIIHQELNFHLAKLIREAPTTIKERLISKDNNVVKAVISGASANIKKKYELDIKVQLIDIYRHWDSQ